MPKRTRHESQQLRAIQAWKREEPGVVSKTFGVVLEPLAWLIKKVVPEAAIRGALDFSSSMAGWLTDTKDVIRDGGVSSIEELRTKNLALSDRLANEVHNWAIGLAVVEGAGTGAFGILGAAVDVPAVITLALRTIHKTGVCYGYECKTELDKKYALGILAVSAANSVSEKVSAIATLRTIHVAIQRVTWKKMAEKAAKDRLSKEAAIVGVRALAKQLGINITKRRALTAIPVVGAAVGGSVNGWYIKEVGWAARRFYQERWLRDNGKLNHRKDG